MQKKVRNSKYNTKKASPRDASKEVRRNSIFNYDLEVESDKEQRQKAKRIQKKQEKRTDEDQYIGMKELPPLKKKKKSKWRKKFWRWHTKGRSKEIEQD